MSTDRFTITFDAAELAQLRQAVEVALCEYETQTTEHAQDAYVSAFNVAERLRMLSERMPTTDGPDE